MAPDRGCRTAVAAALGILFVCGPAFAESALDGKGWKESPFLAERGGPSWPIQAGPDSSGEETLLQGILWDPRAPAAIVNNHLVGVGDRVGRWRVAEIRKDRVLLSDGESTRELDAR